MKGQNAQVINNNNNKKRKKMKGGGEVKAIVIIKQLTWMLSTLRFAKASSKERILAFNFSPLSGRAAMLPDRITN